MSLQPASQNFASLLNNTVLSQCGHVFTASFTELRWRFTAHHSTAPWAPFDSDLFDIKVFGAVSGGGGDGDSTPCTSYLAVPSLRLLMFTYTEGRPMSTRKETVTRTETRHPHRENRVSTPRDTFTHTEGKASPTQRYLVPTTKEPFVHTENT